MFKFTTLTFLSFLISCVSFAQWTQSNGPLTSGVYTLAFKDNLTFAGTSDGVFVSDNNGLTWQARNGKAMEGTYFSSNYGINEIFITKKGTILAASYSGGLLRSTDDGKNWDLIIQGNGFYNPGEFIKYLFEDDSHLFMVKKGYYISEDDGITWKTIGVGSNYDYVITAKGQHVFFGTDQGIWVSHDLGKTTMKALLPGFTYKDDIYTSSLINKDGNIYASTRYGIYVTKDEGQSWELINKDMGGKLFVANNKIYLYWENKFTWHVSDDNGKTWIKISDTIEKDFKIINKPSGSAVFLRKYEGTISKDNFFRPLRDIYLSNTSDASFSLFAKGFIRESIKNIVLINDVVLANNEFYSYFSTDKGISWQQTTYRDNLIFYLSTKNKVFATENGKVVVTEDGITWKNFNTGLSEDKYIESFQVNILTLYAIASSGEIYRFNESIDSWQLDRKIAYDFTKNTNRIAITANKVFIGKQDSIVIYDTKNNTRQSSYLHGKANLIAVDEKVFANNNGSDYLYTVISETGIYLYNQTTNKWDKKIKGLEKNIPSPPNSIHNLQYAKNFLFVSKSDGLFYSKDWGENWQILEDGLPEDVAPYSVFLTSDKIWVAMANREYTTQVSANLGVWSLPLKQEFVLAAESEVKDKSNALQLYPNPVTDKLNITYFTRQSAGKAKAQIFNALGQVVSQVSNFQISGDGSLAKEVALSDIPAGRYFIRIEDSGKSVVKSFIKE